MTCDFLYHFLIQNLNEMLDFFWCALIPAWTLGIKVGSGQGVGSRFSSLGGKNAFGVSLKKN